MRPDVLRAFDSCRSALAKRLPVASVDGAKLADVTADTFVHAAGIAYPQLEQQRAVDRLAACVVAQLTTLAGPSQIEQHLLNVIAEGNAPLLLCRALEDAALP